MLRQDQVTSTLAHVRARAGAEGVLGVYIGNPTGGTLYPLGMGEFYDGHTAAGEMTMVPRIDGNRVVGQQLPQSSDKWSMARYNQYSQLGGQSIGVLVEATIDCQLDGNANTMYGMLTTDPHTNRGRTGGPVYYD